MKNEHKTYNQYKEHIEGLVSFSRRPGMYVGKEEMNLVLAFLTGIEMATKFGLRFGNDLVEYLFSKHPENSELQELKSNRTFYTLIDQVEILAKNSEKSTTQIFKFYALKFLVYISDEINDGLYKQVLTDKLKKHLIVNTESIDEPFTKTFSSNPEDYILKYLDEWDGKKLPVKQMEILRNIKNENSRRNLEWIKQKEGQIDDKSILRKLSKSLLEEITRDNT